TRFYCALSASRLTVNVDRCYCFIFFFFQAEDGIRDLIVTGVQTCALPIFSFIETPDSDSALTAESTNRFRVCAGPLILSDTPGRSEERRVGKECRGRWAR